MLFFYLALVLGQLTQYYLLTVINKFDVKPIKAGYIFVTPTHIEIFSEEVETFKQVKTIFNKNLKFIVNKGVKFFDESYNKTVVSFPTLNQTEFLKLLEWTVPLCDEPNLFYKTFFYNEIIKTKLGLLDKNFFNTAWYMFETGWDNLPEKVSMQTIDFTILINTNSVRISFKEKNILNGLAVGFLIESALSIEKEDTENLTINLKKINNSFDIGQQSFIQVVRQLEKSEKTIDGDCEILIRGSTHAVKLRSTLIYYEDYWSLEHLNWSKALEHLAKQKVIS